MAEQLTFNLPMRESRERGDFFISEANALAVARLDDTSTWPNGKLVLIGPQGAGKSHLANVWAEQNGAEVIDAGDLGHRDIPAIATPLALEMRGLQPSQEEVVFHTHNHMLACRLPLLLIARTPPASWKLVLPDLKSRMEATDTVRIEGPDDALLAAVMVKQFADRQLAVAPNVIDWLVRNMDRSFAEAQKVVVALDQAALSEGRAITRPLAQRIIADRRDD
ncbi:MAG: DnaA/Hda family protein [Pseudomonadota bacterium]